MHPEDLPAGVTPEDVLRARESYFEKPSRSVLDALTDAAHQHSVILGDPGSGKSTLARYLLLSLLGVEGDTKLRRAFEGHLPLLVELRSYAGLRAESKCDTFLQFVEYLSQEEGWGLDAKALEHYLKEDGRAVVVFDGLDEIFDPEEREAAARRIAGFAASYPKARVVVTSRVIGYRRKVLTDAEFSHFTLQDLDERQVEQFIDRWYALALDERPEEARARRERIMRSFKDSPSIRQLAGNPMLLTIMAIIGKNQELPRERWKLYDHAASVLIHHWDVERHLRDRHLDAPFIGEDEKKEMLRRLAFKMQDGAGGLAGNYIHRDDLKDEFETYLRDRFAQIPPAATTIARAMIDQFRERNFILSLHGANLYGFVHRAFLEFFCASSLVQKFEKTKERTIEGLSRDIYGAHWEDQTWHEVLRLICGMIDEEFAGIVIRELARQTADDIEASLPWNLALAWQCLNELRNPGAVEEIVNDVVDATFRFYAKRLFTEENLAEFHRAHILPYILDFPAIPANVKSVANWTRQVPNFLHSSISAATLFDVGKVIGKLGGGAEPVRRVTNDLLNDRFNGYEVGLFALAQGWQGDAAIFEKLLYTATNNSVTSGQETAIWALVEYYGGDPNALSVLLELGRTAACREVRMTVLEALCNHFTNSEQVLSLLYDRATNDPDQIVRDVADNLTEVLTGGGRG
ncbi:MAG: NACHT domain-containing protein [Pyrinomonadaceae bacterium]